MQKSFINRLYLVLQISKIPLKILRLRIFCVYGVETKQGQTLRSLVIRFYSQKQL
jgi:hypothetical protein